MWIRYDERLAFSGRLIESGLCLMRVLACVLSYFEKPFISSLIGARQREKEQSKKSAFNSSQPRRGSCHFDSKKSEPNQIKSRLKPGQPIVSFLVETRIVPHPRMTQRGKWVKKQAQRYLSWKSGFATEIKRKMEEEGIKMFSCPVWLSLKIKRKGKRRADLKNLLASVEDALNRVLWQDDSLILLYKEIELETNSKIDLLFLEVGELEIEEDEENRAFKRTPKTAVSGKDDVNTTDSRLVGLESINC